MRAFFFLLFFIVIVGHWVIAYCTEERMKKVRGMMPLLAVREFRFDFGLSDEEMSKFLQATNDNRKNTEHCNKKVEKAARGASLKPPLAKSPFLRDIDCGKAREGFWDSNHVPV